MYSFCMALTVYFIILGLSCNVVCIGSHFFLLLNSIPLCECTTICLPSHLLMDILAITNKTAVNIFVQVFYGHIFPLSGKYQGMGWVNHMIGISLFVLKKLPNCFLKWLYNLHPVFNFQEVAMALFIPFFFSCFLFWTTRSLKVERDHVSPNGPLQHPA